MNMFQRWKQTSLHNKALVLSSVIVAFGTLFYAGAASVQICLMKQSAKQTAAQIDKIIVATGVQAQAAKDFATSADGINTQTKLAVDKFDRMAKASESSIRTIQETAKNALDASIQASRLDERPWVVGDNFVLSGEPEEGKMPTTKITVRNTGKTPALSMFPISQPSIWDHCAPLDESKLPAPKSIGVLAPGQTGISFTIDALPYIKRSVDEYTAGLSRYCVRAKIIYVDVNQIPHWTTLCIFHTHGRALNEFDYCSEGNDVDRNK